MKKRKSNIKWWVLGIFLASVVFMGSLGYARDYSSSICVVVIVFAIAAMIAAMIDAYREKRWRKDEKSAD